MSHLLSTLQNVSLDSIKDILEKDKEFHKSQGMYLEYLWQNTDKENEVLFLFKIDSVEKTKILIQKLHSEALAQNPEANLPTMTYLKN